MMFAPLTDEWIDSVAAPWHQGWRDGHIGLVPDGLLPFRTLDSFRDRLALHLARVTVVVDEDALAGFSCWMRMSWTSSMSRQSERALMAEAERVLA